jgi:hypothetical protein
LKNSTEPRNSKIIEAIDAAYLYLPSSSSESDCDIPAAFG